MVPQQQRRRRRRAALPRAGERRVVVARGAGGFGFTIAGQRPCVVSAVAAGGPAERAGLRAGDALLAVDGASVARAPHASVARLVAAAPGAIVLSVAPRDAPPTDTEDTEPDERARVRRRHPPPRHHRRPHPPLTHHPGCQAAPSTSAVSEILQRLTRAQLSPSHAARLECRAVVGYLGTIETPQAESTGAPGNVRIAVRKLRQERRTATPVLLSVLPGSLVLRRPAGQPMATYSRERIVYAGCPSDADRRYFGLVTAAESPDAMDIPPALCTHVFAVDPRAADHEAHTARARDFHILCTRDPVAERCLEFPPSAEYVVGVIRGMYSLPPDDGSPALLQISKLTLKGDSPAAGNFVRNRNALLARDRPRNEDAAGFIANSPQPSNHSEITTTSSNSDSGIGFHNDGRNITDRIVVVDFAGQPPALSMNRFRQEMPRRPLGLVGCSSFDADGSFLSNTTPVVDGFGGQGRPLDLDDVLVNSLDLPARHVSPRGEYDVYNYNNIYGNAPSTSRDGAVYDQVYTENEGHYELLPDGESATYNSVDMYEEQAYSAESVGDSVSVYSSRSVEEPRVAHRRHLQTSLDDMLVLGRREPTPNNDDTIFLHPAAVKCKVRKSKNLLSRTREMFTGKGRDKERRRAMSASAGDVTAGGGEGGDALPATASEPDLRDAQSEQQSPFRRWTTGGGAGAGSSYRHADHRVLFNKQMSEGAGEGSSSGSQWPNGGVARWSLGLDQLLKDPAGAAAFAAFLRGEYAHENLLFYNSCELYTKTMSERERESMAREIWQRHLAEGANEPVNVDAAARRSASARMEEFPPPPDMFATGDSEPQQARPTHPPERDCFQLLVRHPVAGDNSSATPAPDLQSIVINFPCHYPPASCGECDSYHRHDHQPPTPRQHRAQSVPPDASYYEDMVRRGFMDPRFMSTRTSSVIVEPSSSYAASSDRASTPNSDRNQFSNPGRVRPYNDRPRSPYGAASLYPYEGRADTPSEVPQRVPQQREYSRSPSCERMHIEMHSVGVRRQSFDHYQGAQYRASTPHLTSNGYEIPRVRLQPVRSDKSGLLSNQDQVEGQVEKDRIQEPNPRDQVPSYNAPKPILTRSDMQLHNVQRPVPAQPAHSVASNTLEIPTVTVTDVSSTPQVKTSQPEISVYDEPRPSTSFQDPLSTASTPQRRPAFDVNCEVQTFQDEEEEAQRQIYNMMRLDLYPRFLRSSVHAECARADLRGLPPPYSSPPPIEQLPSTPSKEKKDEIYMPVYIKPPVTNDTLPVDDLMFDGNGTLSRLVRTPSPIKKCTKGCPCSCKELINFCMCCGLVNNNNSDPYLDRSATVFRAAGEELQEFPASTEPSTVAAPAAKVRPVPHLSDVPSSASNAAAAAQISSTSKESPPFLLSDVVKSGALCRVVLPDGATSVVGVDGSVTVRRLIDRLLARRNLHANGTHYDVILKDAPQGENPVIDGGAPSTVLGGREVLVERRCVVRLEVGGRCVAVRCRPQRRLRHVLRPVIARYAPAGAGVSYKATVLKDGVPLHPDTPMQEIDGARLTMVEISEPSAEAALDDDAESLSEIAVRLEAPSDAPDDGRVRAALRPGPPLHHHPPDFLDNLRETQRARLAGAAKSEPTPAPRAPPPRAPPPLPPKPPRQPTLV